MRLAKLRQSAVIPPSTTATDPLFNRVCAGLKLTDIILGQIQHQGICVTLERAVRGWIPLKSGVDVHTLGCCAMWQLAWRSAHFERPYAQQVKPVVVRCVSKRDRPPSFHVLDKAKGHPYLPRPDLYHFTVRLIPAIDEHGNPHGGKVSCSLFNARRRQGRTALRRSTMKDGSPLPSLSNETPVIRCAPTS